MANGLVLTKLDLSSLEEFQQQVSEQAEDVELTLDDNDRLVHDAQDVGE